MITTFNELLDYLMLHVSDTSSIACFINGLTAKSDELDAEIAAQYPGKMMMLVHDSYDFTVTDSVEIAPNLYPLCICHFQAHDSGDTIDTYVGCYYDSNDFKNDAGMFRQHKLNKFLGTATC